MLAVRKHQAEDTLLLTEIRSGSRVAFDRLYESYRRDVFQEAYKRLQDVGLAGDIVQEVFISLWEKACHVPILNLPGYLYISIKNKVLRTMQQQSRFVPVPELLEELKENRDWADAALLYRELYDAFRVLVEALPEQQRLIFRMRFDEDLTPDEIAEKLNLSPKTVRNHLGRAIGKLKGSLSLVAVLLILKY